MRTFVDLFAGAGLFSAGFVAAGFRPVLALDVNPFAIDSYRRNISAVAITSSVHHLVDIQADVLIAGPPCQGFSSLGTRDPDDERNVLCLAIAKWACATHASIVVVENVLPFLNSSQWRRMTAALRRLGYQISTWRLNAADYGTPQYRLRSFTIASKIGMPNPPIPSPRVPAQIAFEKIRGGDPMHLWPTPSEVAAIRMKLIPSCGDHRALLIKAPELCPPSWFRLGTQATDVWGRIDPARPANTLKSRFQNPSTGRYIHPKQHRVISLREGARLQGVPDGWIFVGNREAMVRQIGNGVPLPLGTSVARQIVRAFTKFRSCPRRVA